MKRIEEIKEEYAIEKGFDNWYSLYKDHVFRINEFANHMDEISKRYATEYAKEALNNAYYRADIKINIGYTYNEVLFQQSILSEDNLPKH